MEIESQNHRYWDMLFWADEAFLEEEKKKEVLKETIHVECEVTTAWRPTTRHMRAS